MRNQSAEKLQAETGRREGLQLVLDGHTDQIKPGSISDNFLGFHVVVDGKQNYPFTSKNGIPVKSGQENEVIIRATRFESDTLTEKEVTPFKRNCYFSNEVTSKNPMKMYKNYTQTNCLFECRLEAARKQMIQNNLTKNECVPWFYPKGDEHIFKLCDPWGMRTFQNLFQNINDEQCNHCLPDCRSTHYLTTLSSAPFGYCDRTNLMLSPLCDLSTKRMMMNPPIWKHTIQREYETFNGKNQPEFMTSQPNVLANIRKYATEKEAKNLALRAQNEKNPSYNAFEKDITIVNFYFDETDVVQYIRYLRMTPLDFISKVRIIDKIADKYVADLMNLTRNILHEN